MKQAQQYFHLVGSSQTECDTIPGRQCMASCFFLVKQFEDVLIYLTVRRIERLLGSTMSSQFFKHFQAAA